jgi:hypothetical protein
MWLDEFSGHLPECRVDTSKLHQQPSVLVVAALLLQTPIVGLDLPHIAGFPPPVSVGAVYQRFSNVEAGLVENIIEFSLPFWLEEQNGGTFTVQARWAKSSDCLLCLFAMVMQHKQLEIANHWPQSCLSTPSTCAGHVDNIIESSMSKVCQCVGDSCCRCHRCCCCHWCCCCCCCCCCSYDVASPRRIRLIFNQAEVGQLRINPTVEMLLAPALLPRGTLNQQLLLALREVSGA